MDQSWHNKIEDMKNGKHDLSTANLKLEVYLDRFDWFYTSVVEGNSICVYVEHMGKDVMEIVPHDFCGHQVKVAFSAHFDCGDKYGKNMSSPILNMLSETD